METLWITLPTNEENKLKEILNLISNKNLANLSINQLIEKLENNQAGDWIEVLDKYNSIPSINNINTLEMLVRAEGVKNKFGQRGYPQLKNQEFEPRELLGLIILCYSNPNLIGPKLCKALNDNNEADIKKEILGNSARVKDRVAPWASNLRLANYAFYANDTLVRLPVEVINRVKHETIQKRLTVHIIDQRGGFDEWVNGTERASRIRRDGSEIDSYAILQSLKSSEYDSQYDLEEDFDYSLFQLSIPAPAMRINYFVNKTESGPEVLALNGTNNAESSTYGSGLLMGSLAVFHIARHTPVFAVLRNMGKDLAKVRQHIGGFFSKNVESEEQRDQEITSLSPTAKF